MYPFTAFFAGRRLRSSAGFSLPELLIAVTIMLIISSVVTTALMQVSRSQRTIWNRTELHAGVRAATELLQQEIGQAGRTALPGGVPTTLTAPVLATATVATLAAVDGIFVGEQLLIDPGSNQETVDVSAVDTGARQITIARSVDAMGATIQASFVHAHAFGAGASVLGGFASGIVPPAPGFPNGSTNNILKLYGDINGDGNMMYAEYTCDYSTDPGTLYRNVMPFTQVGKPALTVGQTLLANLEPNPDGTACFTYMPNPLPVVSGSSYVLDVAVTLTVRTQLKDPVTNQYQTETKALLNVSPRNVFNVWQLASAGMFDRVQPMPPTVTALLPDLP